MLVRHLPELEDSAWFPKSLRDYQTDFLGKITALLGLYDPVRYWIDKNFGRTFSFVDLCSGSGIPAIAITQNKRSTGATLILTDRYPNARAGSSQGMGEGVLYRSKPLELPATEMPIGDCYLMFNSFHHFSEGQLLEIVKNADRSGSAIVFVDPIQPAFLSFLKVFFSTLLLPFFIVPFIRPFRFDRIIYTYFLPIGVLVTLWDGLASVLKSYSERRLGAFAEALRDQGIKVETGVHKGSFANLTYIRTPL